MSTKLSNSQLVDRRANLLVQLFLEELTPAFVAQPSGDFGFDYFVGFTNPQGGVNTYGVEVRATEKRVRDHFRVPAQWYHKRSSSNIPVLLIVADVKSNVLYYAWLNRELSSDRSAGKMIAIPVTEINDAEKQRLREMVVACELDMERPAVR